MNWKKWIFFLAALGLLSLFWFRKPNPSSAQKTIDSQSDPAHNASEPSTSNQKSVAIPSSHSAPSSGLKPRRPTAAGGSKSNLDLKSYLNQQDPAAQWFVTKTSSGEVSAISGGLLRPDLSTSEKSLEFARSLAERLGYDPAWIQPAPDALPQTADTRALRFSQFIDGFRVFGSEMNVFTRNKDGAVYYVTNELRPIREVELRQSHSLKEAQAALQSLFSPERQLQVEKLFPTPVISLRDDRKDKGELCWQIQAQILKPRKERRMFFVSAHTLELVRDVNLTVSN